MRRPHIALLVASVLLLVPASADAAFFGSSLTRAPNIALTCGTAIIRDQSNFAGGAVLAPTGQRTCTYRSVGILLGSLTTGSVVPGSGVITSFSVRSGSNPAPVRLTVMQGSPGLCCTAEKFSPVFRPRPNRITRFRVNMSVRVTGSVSPGIGRQVVDDYIGLTAVGPGTLPLRVQRGAGQFNAGLWQSQSWWPRVTLNQPRNEDAYGMTGVELLLRWEWQRRR